MLQKKSQEIPQVAKSNLIVEPPPSIRLTADSVEQVLRDAEYQQHPYGKVWHQYDVDTLSELADNIQLRGQDQPILLYQGKVLDGWHRYLACLLSGSDPAFIEFTGTDLEAAEKVHASGVRRQSTAAQRYAAFLALTESCPEFKAKYAELKQEGRDNKSAGTPLSTGGQRVDVLGAKAAAAKVSRSTAAKVEKLKKAKPEAVTEVAQGKVSVNQALKSVGKKTSTARKTRKPAYSQHVSEPSEETGCVTIQVSDRLVAEITEFLEDFGISSRTTTKNGRTAFQFNGTANDQNNLLTAIGDLIMTKGPMQLDLQLQRI